MECRQRFAASDHSHFWRFRAVSRSVDLMSVLLLHGFNAFKPLKLVPPGRFALDFQPRSK